ncbi:MAG: HYR domain-containing protein [Verrucomicrobia bacterium]|nr:HYR domain-containing protein [Verrucomicrobiota bacterium]
MKTSCKKLLLSSLAAAGLLLGGSPNALAAPVTIRFTAVVTDRDAEFPSTLQIGSLITGSYTYESSTPDSLPDSLRIGLYGNAVTAMTMSFDGGVTRTLSTKEDNYLEIHNNIGGGRRELEDTYFLDATVSGGYNLQFSLHYFNGNEWASDALPLTAPRLPSGLKSDGNYEFLVYANAAGGYHVRAQVLSLQLAGDTTPPVLSLPANLVVEATGPAGAVATYSASATDDTDGAVPVTLNPASGSTFALGTTTVNASATDAAGNTASGSFTVSVQDTTAPVITSLRVSSAVLWPPNHKMVSVTVSGEATEAVSEVTGRILSVTSNEPDDGLGDGDTAGDIVITSPGTVSLRAERSGKGNGRIYTILFEVRDAAGNASTRTTTVSVPKSQGK